MLQVTKKLAGPANDDLTVTLTFEQRSKSRLRASLDGGGELAIALERGSQLLPGDLLVADSGEVVAVRAADETLSVVQSNDQLLIAKACYHLGNRHVALQISAQEIRYQHDHVLDDMVAGLGLAVSVKKLPFTPESGAYGSHAHISGHRH